jgi:hypothetical protein
MPFLGYAILYHTELSEYLGGLGGLLDVQGTTDVESRPGSGNGYISLYAKLNLIYLGLFFVGVGSIIYRLFVPKTIKEFKSVSHYSEVELARTSARRLRSMMVAIRSRRPTVADGLLAIGPWLDRDECNLKTASNELRGLEDDQLKNDVLSSFYNVQSRYAGRVYLYLTVLLYVVGFACLSIPSLLFTFRVLKIVILSAIEAVGV